MRLLRALEECRPAGPRQFFALTSQQLRRELIDLARRYYGPEGIGAHHDSDGLARSSSSGGREFEDRRQEPASLARWTELHELIWQLPDEERDVVGALFYQGLSQPEAAELLNLSLRTVQRRWHDALCRLHGAWVGE